MSITPKFTKFLVCKVMRLSVVGTREREEVEMEWNEVWLLAFDERGGCIVIAFRLQAYHLIKVINPNRTLHRLSNILSCLHCFLSIFCLLVGIFPVLLS